MLKVGDTLILKNDGGKPTRVRVLIWDIPPEPADEKEKHFAVVVLEDAWIEMQDFLNELPRFQAGDSFNAPYEDFETWRGDSMEITSPVEMLADYTSIYVLYENRKAWEDEKEADKYCKAFRSTFDEFGRTKFTLEQLRGAAKILGIKLNEKA